MIVSMTGFGSKEAKIAGLGKVNVEFRSTNHKFLEIVFHLPVGLVSLEDKIKKAVEAKIKRGRIACVITFVGEEGAKARLNKTLLKDYFVLLKNIKKEFDIVEGISLNTLLHLPGVLAFEESKVPKENAWQHLKLLVDNGLESLVKMRQKEGKALGVFLKNRASNLRSKLEFIKKRSKKALGERLKKIAAPEERSSFLRETDITEEIERISFHINNFKNKLAKSGPIGKELDFIAQEMQREANTMGAKTFDIAISARVIQIKSQIEKIREQVQNIE